VTTNLYVDCKHSVSGL